jgi:hypothetical protein
VTHPRMEVRTATKIGIFRRIAVERYMQPLQMDMPSLLPRCGAVAAGLGLLMLAAVYAVLLLF